MRLTIQRDTSALTLSERVEVGLYKSLPPIPMADAPVLWWWEKRAILPLLTNIATSYLCAQASSAPSERVFSTQGNTLSQERSRLLPEKANILLKCLRCLKTVSPFAAYLRAPPVLLYTTVCSFTGKYCSFHVFYIHLFCLYNSYMFKHGCFFHYIELFFHFTFQKK